MALVQYWYFLSARLILLWWGHNEQKLHSVAGDSCLSPPFFVCLQDTYHPKICGFLSVWRLLLFFVYPWTSLCLQRVWFPATGPVPPLSLLISSYMPAVTWPPASLHYKKSINRLALWMPASTNWGVQMIQKGADESSITPPPLLPGPQSWWIVTLGPHPAPNS